MATPDLFALQPIGSPARGPIDLFGDDTAGFGPVDLFADTEETERERGFFGTMLHELGRDITGAARTVIAPVGSLTEAFGAEAPVTIEDLSSRDLTGAAMVASMFVGGIGASAARSALAGQGLRGASIVGRAFGNQAQRKAAQTAARSFTRDLNFVKRTAITASTEGASGAFFGGVRPLESGEDRLEAVLDDTALFAGLGGAFSMLGSGVRATVGTKLAEIRQQVKNAGIATIARREETRTFLQEFAGVRLRAPETGSTTEIKRLADGTVRMRTTADGAASVDDFSDFNTALSRALESGHSERLGAVRPSLNQLRNLEDFDQSVIDEIGDVGFEEALGQLDLAQYRASREWARANADQAADISWLSAETLSENVGEFGAISFSDSQRASLISTLEGSPQRLGQMSDSQLLRETMKQGRVSITNLADAREAKDYVKEVFINDRILGDTSALVAMPSYDVTFLARVMTPQTVAKLHPSVQPIFDLADAGARAMEVGGREINQFTSDIRDRFPRATMERVVNIIDDNVGDTVTESRAAAMRAAQDTGDAEIIDGVREITNRLNVQRLRLVGSGRLGEVIDPSADLREAAQRAEASGRRLPTTREEFQQLSDEGQNPRQDLLFHVTDADTLEPREGIIWLSQENPIDRAGNIFLIDRRKLDPSLLKEGGRRGRFGRYEGVIPENAFVRLGERGPRSEFRFNLDTLLEGTRRLETKAQQLTRRPAITEETTSRARAILAETSTGATDGDAVERAALQAARTEGDAVHTAVRELIDSSGRAGYFPIAHQQGGWRLTIDGLPEGVEHRLTFENREAALNELERVTREHGAHAASILPKTFTLDGATAGLVDGSEFGRMVQAIRSAVDVELSADDAAELLQRAGTTPSGGPRKFSQFLQPRKLGWREFTEDPFRTLEFYLYNTERALSFNEFERNASRLIEAIPGQKSQLKAWSEDYVNRILGRPTKAEEMIDNFIRFVAPRDVAPRATKRYSAFLRRATAFSRLGGVMSGLVNSTQIAINTAPIIGTRWTGVGLQKILTRDGLDEIRETFAREGIDLGLHMSLSREGELIAGEGIKDGIRSAYKRAGHGETASATRKAIETFERMWLYVFNGTERLNRTVTAWGAYQRGLRAEGMTQRQALDFAREQVEKTQFNYRRSNIPTLMQGPIGGLVGQFKTFFINEMELIATVDNATRMRMLAAFSAAGGLSALTELPGADVANHASEWLFDKKISEALAIEGGREDAPALSRALAFGLPGLVAGLREGSEGVDLSRYVGPGGFFEMTQGWAGPAAGDFASLGQFLGNATRDLHTSGTITADTYNNLYQQAIPSQIRRFTRGLDIITDTSLPAIGLHAGTGEVRNPYSRKLIYRPERRLSVAAMTALGPPSGRQSAERAADDLISRQARRYNEVRRSYGRSIGVAAGRGATAELNRLVAEANQRGMPFERADVNRWSRLMSQPISERRQQRVPTAIRADLEEFFSLE